MSSRTLKWSAVTIVDCVDIVEGVLRLSVTLLDPALESSAALTACRYVRACAVAEEREVAVVDGPPRRGEDKPYLRSMSSERRE
jgi:hypothetical protein